MVSKCASPGCLNPFRYFHEGKLYLVESSAASSGGKPSAERKAASTPRTIKFAWLCSSCCRYMTIQNDGDGIRVVYKRKILSSSERMFLR